MRRLLFASVLLLAACGDKQEVSQNSGGDFSPNQVAGRDAIQNVNVQLSKAAEERLLQGLIAKGVPEADRAAELEELKRKYADLQQRLGEYTQTDELAQQARKELDAGNLDQAETLLQQAYDKDLQLSKQRLAKRAFDLAEVAELRLDHDKALAKYREVTQLQPENVEAWWRFADIAQTLGNTSQALDAWRGMQQAAQTQHQERELAAAIMGEADILKANGDGKAAQEKYFQAHEALKKAAETEPDNTDRQRDLSVSYERIGDLYVANGDTPAALKSYQDSLSIAQKLVELDPKQAEWQRDLSVSYNKVGDLYKANGDAPAALKLYQDSLTIRKKLVELDPKQAEWQRDLSVSYNKVGDLYKANGDTPAALKSYQESHEIFKKLVELDPKQAEWQRGLSVSYNKVGDLYKANGDTPAAMKAYQDSQAIFKKLVEFDPKQVQWQRDLSVNYEKIGDLYTANGDTPAALKSYQDSLSIRKMLVELDPKQTEWQTDLAVSYFKLSKVEPAKKKQYPQDALQILETLNAENHLSKDKQAWISIIKDELRGK